MEWTERYRPDSLAAVRGNDKARGQLREWAENWPNNGRAVILHGDPGVGKTSAAHALASDMGWEPMELNASDNRTAAVSERVAGEAAATRTFTGGRTIVILDEADNLHQHKDRGGASAITGIIKDAEQPVVLIANDFYEMSRGLRNACEGIEFRGVPKRDIISALRDICRKEGIAFEDAALEKIAAGADGDLRSAINDLQAIADESTELTSADVVTGTRNRGEGIFPFLDSVFKEATPQEALSASYDVDETPDDMLFWVEDNVPKDYTGAELADAYRRLAAADRWLGRVRATQEYRFWRYATDNIAAGVAAARRGEKGGWTRYGPPSYWRKLGQSRGQRSRRDSVAREIATASNVSMATARRDVLPYLSHLTHHCQNRPLSVAMARTYELDEEQVAFVTGSGKDTNKVGSIVADAEADREERTLDAAPTGGRTEEPVGPEAESGDSAEPNTAEESDDQAGLSDFV